MLQVVSAKACKATTYMASSKFFAAMALLPRALSSSAVDIFAGGLRLEKMKEQCAVRYSLLPVPAWEASVRMGRQLNWGFVGEFQVQNTARQARHMESSGPSMPFDGSQPCDWTKVRSSPHSNGGCLAGLLGSNRPLNSKSIHRHNSQASPGRSNIMVFGHPYATKSLFTRARPLYLVILYACEYFFMTRLIQLFSAVCSSIPVCPFVRRFRKETYPATAI